MLEALIEVSYLLIVLIVKLGFMGILGVYGYGCISIYLTCLESLLRSNYVIGYCFELNWLCLIEFLWLGGSKGKEVEKGGSKA